jgi:hypothetical protein
LHQCVQHGQNTQPTLCEISNTPGYEIRLVARPCTKTRYKIQPTNCSVYLALGDAKNLPNIGVRSHLFHCYYKIVCADIQDLFEFIRNSQRFNTLTTHQLETIENKTQ